jgi:hypothetical protein
VPEAWHRAGHTPEGSLINTEQKTTIYQEGHGTKLKMSLSVLEIIFLIAPKTGEFDFW